MKLDKLSAVVFINIISFFQYSLPAPILPPEMKHRHISQTATGIVMGVFSLGNILAAYLTTTCLYKCMNRR